MSTNYEVSIEPYAERHFIKTFARKYKGAWDLTLSALVREFQSLDVILEKSIAEEITDRNSEIVICKIEFKISGTRESRHASGNRCIVAVHKNPRRVCILLVYNKTDLGSGPETASWKKIIKENYSDYGGLL